MKTPQRNFIVELKSKRRRSTMPPVSIWGNTDLKAFARQAETDAPHLFEAKTGLGTLSQGDEVQSDRMPQRQIDDHCEGGSQNQGGVSLNESGQSVSSQNDRGRANSMPRSKKPRAERRRPDATTATDDTGPEAYLDSTTKAGDERSATAEVETAIDELVALDAENRHLKALLSKQLHQQNIRLRKMLERFGVS
ncbi:hypothetical protein CO657_28575 (plasmid) [Rhizobium acidisoli]|uniref:Uncharacterized protein n=1 Tax=Rhizobium acidisoli TaxID=1538158 RepID=A0AAE5WSS3_9HYPH|nr:hypothetical protein [Rhizobium acidisoli]KPH05320.1 hypothetical protein AOG23_28655 [Rhizobium acidisoli]QAS81812.1 hypothetical protein CO657_28575 [Rhizobium acidisoli]